MMVAITKLALLCSFRIQPSIRFVIHDVVALSSQSHQQGPLRRSTAVSSISSSSLLSSPTQLSHISATIPSLNNRNNPRQQRQQLRLLASVTGDVYIDDDNPQSPMVTLYTKEGTK
jgi:hypothetical protein